MARKEKNPKAPSKRKKYQKVYGVKEKDKGDGTSKDKKPTKKKRARTRKELKDRLKRKYGAFCHYPKRFLEPYTPWVVIPYENDDLGSRPVPNGEIYWDSPNIYVESPDMWGRPVANKENFLHARIHNFGAATAAPVKVDFYYGEGSMTTVAEDLNYIGTEWVSVDSQRSVDVRCEQAFIPPTPVGGIESTPYSFLVNCSCLYFDQIRHPFMPQLDRHVGLKNMTVIDVNDGNPPIPIPSIDPWIRHHAPVPGKAEVWASVASFTVLPELLREFEPLELLDQVRTKRSTNHNTASALRKRYYKGSPAASQSSRMIGMAEARESWAKASPRQLKQAVIPRKRPTKPTLKAEISESLGKKMTQNSWRQTGELYKAISYLNKVDSCNDNYIPLIDNLTLEPFESRKLFLEIIPPYDIQPGDFFVIDLQIKINQLILGGYRIFLRG